MKRVKLAIDFGSANMKSIGMINGTEKRILIKSLANIDGMNDKFIVEFNNRKINFGVGVSLVKREKMEREFVIESVFLNVYEIYGEIDNEFEVDLAIGLPIIQYKSNSRIKYEEELRNKYLNKKLTANVDGQDITIKIKFLKIYSEGYSGYVALYDEFQKDIPFLLVDIGYKTTDVIAISKNKTTNKLMIEDYESINKGMLEIFTAIQNKFYDDTGMNYPPETIENAIIDNRQLKTYDSDGVKIAETRQWLKYGSKVLTDIFNSIEIKFPDMKTRNIYLIGGGVEFIQRILNQISKDDKQKTLDVEVLINTEQSMYANAIGYYMQLDRDTITVVESEDVIVNESKLKTKTAVAITEE